MPGTGQMKPPPLWRNRDYRLLWGGNLVSSVGSATILIALPLLVLAITGKPLQTGGVAAAETVPYITLSLPLGVVVDRYPRRRLLIAAGVTSMLASSVIPIAYYLHDLSIGLVYAVAVVVACGSALDEIAQVAVVPKLVAPEHLGAASGQSELIFTLSSIAGPPLAGLLLADGTLAGPFIVDAVSFGVLALAAGLIRADLDPPKSATRARWREETLLGLRTLMQHRTLRALSVLTLTGDFLFSGITVLMTVLVKSRGASPEVIGAVFAIGAVGGVIGSLTATRTERALGLLPSVLGRSWAPALLFPLLATGIPAITLGVVWSLMNVMIAYMNVTQMRLVMTLVPEHVLGRTQSVVTFASYAVLPAGAVFTGALLQYASPRGTIFTYTAILAALAIYATASRDLRAPLHPTPPHSSHPPHHLTPTTPHLSRPRRPSRSLPSCLALPSSVIVYKGPR
jgi:MFS family permease